jgi:MFS family permease
LAFGVFQEYYTTHDVFQGSPGSIATVGTTLTGIMYLMMPLTFTFLTRHPRARPYCGPVGLALTVTSMILSAFATKVWQLIASQGVLCAIGCGLLFSPITLYLDEWFIARKGMAYGTMWAGKSAAGVAMPFVMSSLLNRFGPRTTLLAWAAALFVMTSPLLFFLRPRLPLPPSNASTQRPLSWTFLHQPTFWMLELGNIAQSLGYFLPATYLASYVHTLGLSTLTGTILIAAFNVSSVPGSLVIGTLNDHYAVTTPLLITSLGSAVAVFLFWGLSSQVALLSVFVITYGFFAGGFSSTYPGVLHELKRRDPGVDTGLIMGFLLGGRGLGNVVSGPISAALLNDAWNLDGRWGYNTEYGPLILFTGVTALCGGWGWIWKTTRAVCL